MIVPNRFPTQHAARRIALIGEAPGPDEERLGEPFIGQSGRFLSALLSKAGLTRESCFIGSVLQHRPPGNDLSTFAWNGPEVQHGLAKLREDLDKFQPHVVVLLGNVPLRAAKDPLSNAPIASKGFRFKNSQWRGYMFHGETGGPFAGMKCLSTLHPAYCLRDYGMTPLLLLDLKKAYKEGLSSDLVYPPEYVTICKDFLSAQTTIMTLRDVRDPMGTDIEGYFYRLDSIAFAPSPNDAYVIPFTHTDNTRWWTPAQDLVLFRLLAELLWDPLVPFIWQNGLYDRFVLHYGHRMPVRNNPADIMLKHWELNSELSKGETSGDRTKKGLNIGLQASIYLNRPYWKGDRSSSDDDTFLRYNARDAMVTKEIDTYLDGCLTASCSRRHYQMNVELLNPLLYIELKGMRYDSLGAVHRRSLLQRQMYATQARLNHLTGHCFSWTNRKEILDRAVALMGRKKNIYCSFDDLAATPLKAYAEAAPRLRDLMNQPSPDLSTIGEVEDLCEVSLNVGSNPAMCEYLYDRLGLPTQTNLNDNDEPAPTADYEALLKLSKECTRDNDPRLPIIHMAIELRALQTRQGMLSIDADKDGRIRCGYNVVGSNTGRITCYKSPTGSGYNLQTIPNYVNVKDAPGGVLGDRDLFLADFDYHFFQCDLKGADGWTVAAYCAMLGDRTMLDDYLAGLKPANILALMLRGTAVDFRDRQAIKAASKGVGKDDWDYFACKRVQHGCAYLEGGLTVSRNILKDSEGKMYMTPKEANALKDLFFKRYWGLPKWHDWVARRLKENATLVAASGQVRNFFGRPDEILTKAVAFEPQANTTYVTNLAMQRLWNDNENRSEPNISGTNVMLRIQPLHQVHDALCGQFPKVDTAWAVSKIQSYFNNPVTIAGETLVIPYDGAYGPAWGSLGEKHGGGVL